MQTNYDAASRELMDVKNEKNEVERHSQETHQMLEAVAMDIN